MFSHYFKDYTPYKPPSAFNRVLPLPPISEMELHGQFLDWASQYLYAKQFPWNLITALLKQLKLDFDKLELNTCQIKCHEGSEETKGVFWYHALGAKKVLIDKLDALCQQYAKEYNAEVLEPQLNEPFYEVTSASVKNGRRTLEDRFTVVSSLDHIFDLPVRTSYFAVFDGHDGSEAANFSAAQLHMNLIGLDSFPESVAEAITEACHTTDDEFLLKCITTSQKSGTTVALSLFVDDKLYVAWVGDSQVIVARESTGAVSLVNPHKPGRLDEIQRIMDLGGEVRRYDSSDTWRIDGCLAVSRAIGDPEYKKYVIPTPDIVEVKLDGTEEYLVVATDGLWDEVSAAQCHEIIKSHLISALRHERLSLVLAEAATSVGSKDNITVVVILLKPAKELIAKYITASEKLNPQEKESLLEKLNHMNVSNTSNDCSKSCVTTTATDGEEEQVATTSTAEASTSGCFI